MISLLRENWMGAGSAEGPAHSKPRPSLRSANAAIIAESDQLNATRNLASREIGALMKEGKRDEAETRRREVGELKERISELDHRRDQAEARIHELISTLPNIPHESVPVGSDETANAEVAREEVPPKPEFDLNERPR